jgi:hypothetical protein
VATAGGATRSGSNASCAVVEQSFLMSQRTTGVRSPPPRTTNGALLSALCLTSTHPALSPRGAPTLSAPDAAPSTDHSLPSAVLTTRWVDAEVAKTANTKQEFDSWAPATPGAQVRRCLVVRRPVAAVIGLCLTVGECRRSVL